MKNYLVIRFSAMGDVALTLPVLAEAVEQNPDARFVLLTRPKFAAFFDGYDQIQVPELDVDKEFNGLRGLWKLSRILKKNYQFDAVLDLHQNLRSALLKFFLRNNKTFTISKGRADKRALTRQKNKEYEQLKHATERYAEVLRKASLKVNYDTQKPKNYFKNLPEVSIEKQENWIGLAPFAQHKGKIWPFEKMEELIRQLPSNARLFLFGGGKTEIEALQNLLPLHNDIHLVAGNFSMKEELSLISKLDTMLCMDSSNMHLAALAGVKTVSIWGATHAAAGFGPFGSQKHEIIEVSPEILPCRPCSVYGNKPCLRKDYACLNQISAEEVSYRLFGR